MFNANMFTVRNILVIAVFAITWQLIFSRVNLWLHKSDAPATTNADA